MSKVIIFGLSDYAELAHYYLENDSEHDVTAFCVSKEFNDKGESFRGLPIIDFENVEDLYKTSEFKFFAPMSPRSMNKLREAIYCKIKNMGYEFITYISSHATCLTSDIGENCFILEENTIQPFVRIGNNVVIWSGNHIGHHSYIGDHVTITSQVCVSGHVNIKNYCFVGVNATLRDSITLHEGCLIGMGAVLTKSTEPWSAYMGHPATKHEKASIELLP